MTETKLKPCPFCGGKDLLVDKSSDNPFVTCCDCLATINAILIKLVLKDVKTVGELK